MSSKRRNIRMKKPNRQNSARNPKRNIGSGIVLYKAPRTMMPEEFTTNLKYIVQDVVANNGNTKASIKFRTEAYDVDPALASTAMPGFTEFAAFYQRYRALEIGYKFSAANQEGINMTVIHGFSILTIASGSLNIEYAGNPLFQTSVLGPLTGNNTRIFQDSKPVWKIAGTRQALYDDLYTGSTTSATLATAGTVYCHFGIITPVAMTAAGCLVTVEITLKVQFYRPNFLLV